MPRSYWMVRTTGVTVQNSAARKATTTRITPVVLHNHPFPAAPHSQAEQPQNPPPPRQRTSLSLRPWEARQAPTLSSADRRARNQHSESESGEAAWTNSASGLSGVGSGG